MAFAYIYIDIYIYRVFGLLSPVIDVSRVFNFKRHIWKVLYVSCWSFTSWSGRELFNSFYVHFMIGLRVYYLINICSYLLSPAKIYEYVLENILFVVSSRVINTLLGDKK